MKVRTRFAPSPTGFLHVGGIRTALFAWLLARQAQGQFILRIEDTDRSRLVAGAEQHIQDSLKALGLDWDEGPFKQSDNLSLYTQWANKLIESGRAYGDPYSQDEVAGFREQAQKNKTPFLYRNHRPKNPPEWDGSMALRFKSEPKAYQWHDAVMGDLHSGPEVIDDFILLKSGKVNFPTYNFAHIVDDATMEITHVIRGQEFLASVPNYLNLYEALDLKPPVLATMPHILNEHGNKKLSKRDGAKDVLDYVREGFLPEALINFIASLGWNDGTEQEIFTKEELIKKFSLDHVQKSGARFDEKRLEWMNGCYIRSKSVDELYSLAADFWPQTASAADEPYKKAILGIIQERLKYLGELPVLSNFFFEEPQPSAVAKLYSQPLDKGLKGMEATKIQGLLLKATETLRESDFSPTDLSARLNHLLEELDTKPGVLFAAIRIAITGSPSSPQLSDTLAVLGKDSSIKRLDKAASSLA